MNIYLTPTNFFRCDYLAKNWQDETDLIRKAELINELNSIVKGNEKLKQINWINESLFKIDELNLKTRNSILDQLKSSLKTLNCSAVSSYVKALSLIIDPNSAQREINAIMNEGVRELDALFLQCNTQANSTDKSIKLLPQIGNRLRSFLEQFQLLGIIKKNCKNL